MPRLLVAFAAVFALSLVACLSTSNDDTGAPNDTNNEVDAGPTTVMVGTCTSEDPASGAVCMEYWAPTASADTYRSANQANCTHPSTWAEACVAGWGATCKYVNGNMAWVSHYYFDAQVIAQLRSGCTGTWSEP